MFLETVMHCYNRPPYVDTLSVKAGFTEDGRQLFKTIPDVGTKSCKVDVRATLPACTGCRWQTEKDPRDVQ